MLALMLATVLAQAADVAPAPSAAPPASPLIASEPAPAHRLTWAERYKIKQEQVRCHVLQSVSGIGQRVCVTNREWRHISAEHERMVSDIQTHSLLGPMH